MAHDPALRIDALHDQIFEGLKDDAQNDVQLWVSINEKLDAVLQEGKARKFTDDEMVMVLRLAHYATIRVTGSLIGRNV